jgi:endonuclease/exonuclease/phosphatase family metal-dependent hydrolase
VRRAVAIAVALPWVAWALVRWLGLDTRYPLVAAIAWTPRVPLRGGGARVAGAPPVRVTVVHPLPPLNRSWAPQWGAVMRRLPGADSRGDVQLLVGDFNATLDHRAMRALLGRGYLDAADEVGAGFTWTWPALGHPHTLPITIDHVLVDRRVRALGVTAVRIPGTDHRALIARLRLPRG